MEIGNVENDTNGAECTFIGDEFNPLQEVDKFGRKNPFQDPNRGTMPTFTSLNRGDTGDFPTCVARGVANNNNGRDSGYEDLEPFNLLHNLDGAESIMGRAVVLSREINGNIKTCCIIAREAAPDGFGPKPVPFPLTTHSSTYNSYGSNYAVPLPYHKHGYQATGDVDAMAGNINYSAAMVNQYLN